MNRVSISLPDGTCKSYDELTEKDFLWLIYGELDGISRMVEDLCIKIGSKENN